MLNLIAYLIFLAPLAALLILALGIMSGQLCNEHSERMVSRLSLFTSVLSLFSIAGLFIVSMLAPDKLPASLILLDWFGSGKVDVQISISLDKLALGMGSLFALLLFITLRFSINYLHREPGYQRFFMVYHLFIFAMLMIVLSGNGITAFLGWELAGVSSYLLIAFAYHRRQATTNATRVFITNRVGDASFLLALILSFYWIGAKDWDGFNQAILDLSSLQRGLIIGAFAIAALVKSAQFPFCSWVTRALEGPTPSSAVFYGSVMVHAGIFLLIRISPAIDVTGSAQILLIVSGVLTVLYGWLGGFVQTDVKSAIIFSTLTQTGLMLVSIGLGWTALATAHLATHAIWRAYQMLSAPGYLHLINRSARPVPKWMQSRVRLFNAALQRFWLDHIIDWLAVRPTSLLAQDLNQFDEQVVNRMVGLPSQIDAISSLTDYELRKKGLLNQEAAVATGSGLVGRLLERIASFLHWFEETLVLKGSGDGLISVLRRIGRYLILIDYLFSRPRYLWLMILLTLLVVL